MVRATVNEPPFSRLHVLPIQYRGETFYGDLNVFLFSMNDEIIHTGFYPLAHYLVAKGVGLRDASVDERSGEAPSASDSSAVPT